MDQTSTPVAQPVHRILLASLIGTTIEFFDFYIYATAAVLVFPTLFFPKQDPATAMLQSFATFALAFFARPIGSALFGHFGDRIGRKATLVTALLTMGISTVVIGLLPTYASIGVAAPALLALCRFGQGLGLGGEWGGAVLLATENAPPGKEGWYGSFPQLGAPLGFICSTGVFLAISTHLTTHELFLWGWRVPFLASAVLVLVGLYIRLQLVETPAFRRSLEQGERVRVPLLTVVAQHPRALLLGILGTTTTFLVFYLMTVFALSWATTALQFPRGDYLVLQMAGVLFFGLTIPISAIAADRIGSRSMLILATLAIMAFGFTFAPLFGTHDTLKVFLFLAIGFSLTGFTYGPIGSALASLFPTAVRYTGTSLTFNFAGILGASLAPLIAAHLSSTYGLKFVGYYLSSVGLVTLVALLLIPAPAPAPHPQRLEARKMQSNRSHSLLGLAAAAACVFLWAGPRAQAADRYDSAVAHAGRSAADVQRDALDHPAEILRLTGVGPGMRVADVLAGDGYYSELLSYLVGPKGRVLLINNAAFDAFSDPDLQKRLDGGRLPNVLHQTVDLNDMHLFAGTLDAVLLIKVYHDLYWVETDGKNKWPKIDTNAVLSQLAAALKPGGVLIVADHSAKAGSGAADASALHRIDEAYAVKDIESHGLKLTGKSDLLRRSDDARDQISYKGPMLGKTDRFILVFRKPAQ